MKINKRKQEYTILLSNHASREDNETLQVTASSYEEANKIVHTKVNFNRFSIRGIYLTKELGKRV